MTLVKPTSREQLTGMEPILTMVEDSMGFIPTSMMTMGHWPELLQTFGAFAGNVLNSGEVDVGLKQLIAFVVSNAAGCRYCQAHTSHTAAKRGVSVEKINAAFDFETSDLFDEAERAALRVALHAGIVPNAVEPTHMEVLNEHYSARQCVEIVAVISLFGYLNRWNDTMASSLEETPLAFASVNLRDWEIGKHS